MVLLQLKRYEDAVQSFDSMPEKDWIDYAQLAAACAHFGDAANAALALAGALELRPTLRVSEVAAIIPHREKPALEHYLDGLRKAGLAE